MSTLPAVRINRKAADRLHSGHPWIFASDVLDRAHAEPGAVVKVVDQKGKAWGMAHYSSTSQISLRLLTPHVEPIHQDFFVKRIQAAQAYRQRVVENSNSYRLIHAEGDQLPGLVVDRYGDYLSVQFLNQGMDRQSAEVIGALQEVLAPKGIVARNDVAVRAKEELPLEVKVAAGEVPASVEIAFNQLRLAADLCGGQKTGIFLDQRENYAAVARYAQSGDKALDCFTGSGGFALHLASRCESVEAIDSSAASIASARRNAELNAFTNLDFREANTLQYLPGLVAARRLYDIVIVDPPAFTKSRGTIDDAARGYKEINLRAMRLLRPGALLVSCSCSHHMTDSRFLEILSAAAQDCGRRFQILERRTQARDHVVALNIPETQYLKAYILRLMA